MKINYEILKPFGPSIFKVKIPEEIVNSLNDYVDSMVSNENKSKEFNHGEHLVGDVTQELKIEKDFMIKCGWGAFLGKCVKQWMKDTTGKEVKNIQFLSSWVVRQFENEYNPTHWHGGHISGAGFLKVPSSLGKNTQDKKNRNYYGGCLQFIHGSKMFTSEPLLNVLPKVGDFYFFPNYMMHHVFPFKNSNEERRSISFNAKIDNNIYDVYGS